MALPNEIHPFHFAGAGQGYQVPYSLRFRQSNSAYLNRSYDGGGYTGLFCYSFWIKRGSLGSAQTIHSGGNSGTGYGYLGFTSGDAFTFYDSASGSPMTLTTTQLFRDVSAWYHFFIQIDTTQATASNRVKIWVNGSQITSFSTSTYPNQNTGLSIAYTGVKAIGTLNYTGGSPSNYFDGYLSEFYKLSGYTLSYTNFTTVDNLTGQLKPILYTGLYGSDACYLPFNTVSLSTDLTNTIATLTAPFGGTANNAKLNDSVYVTSNTSTGSSFTFVQQDFGTQTQLTRYAIGALYFTGGTSTFQVQYGNDPTWNSYTVAGSLSVTGSGQNFSGSINGYARYVRLIPTSFGVNGRANVDYFIVYQDGIGLDSSGNGNNFTPNGISVTAGTTYDSMIDSPTNYNDGSTYYNRGSYATGNPLYAPGTSTYTNGNLRWTRLSAGNNLMSTHFVSSGKWYFEFTVNTITSPGYLCLGFTSLAEGYTVYYWSSGNKTIGSGTDNAAYGASFVAGDNVGVALDCDGQTVTFYKNGASQGQLSYSSSGPFAAYMLNRVNSMSSPGHIVDANFGQRPFSYTPPAGYLAMNTYNLPNPSLPLV